MSPSEPSPSGGPVLSVAALNRATLARQGLLERRALDVIAAVEAVGGLQAQEPASPFVALHARLDGFRAEDLDAAIRRHDLVKATMMRRTLHLVSAADYHRLLPALRPMLHRVRRRGATVDDELVRRLGRPAVEHAASPRSNTDLRALVEREAAALGIDLDQAWWWVRLRHDFVHVPSSSSWSYGRRPSLVAAEAWLPDVAFADGAEAVDHLVTRYLGAFGPATLADIAAWSGLPRGTLRPAVERIDGAGRLWHGRTDAGRELVDLVSAPRPNPDVPAPPRLLAMWDSVLLAFADRTRMITDAARSIVIAKNGDTLPTFLVDGQVAGLWWAVAEPGSRTRIELEPFGELAARDRAMLEAEADRLAAFVAPHEPAVYARYRTSRARRPLA